MKQALVRGIAKLRLDDFALCTLWSFAMHHITVTALEAWKGSSLPEHVEDLRIRPKGWFLYLITNEWAPGDIMSDLEFASYYKLLRPLKNVSVEGGEPAPKWVK